MKLKQLKLPSDTVHLPGGDSFTVRGLSLVDVTCIVRGRGPEVKALFDKYAGKIAANEIGDDDIQNIGGSLIEAAPGIAALVIAHGSGNFDAETVEMAARLPFPVQIEAIDKIGKLTFDSEGGIKKVIETVIRVLQGTTSLMEDVRVSKAGFLA